MKIAKIIPIAVMAATLAAPTWADSDNADTKLMSEGLVLPKMDAVLGRELFASKGCVVCHSINGIGGEDAPPLDADYMDTPMNPFDFAARMWRGAESMVELQRDELGDVIELDGEELAAIIAFVHDSDEQKTFSAADIPEEIVAMMGHVDSKDEEADGHGDEEEADDGHGDEEEEKEEDGHGDEAEEKEDDGHSDG